MGNGAEVLETIDLLYRAAVEPEHWREALHRFAIATGGIGTAMIPITPGNIHGLVVSQELDESNVEYSREWWRYDSRVLRIFSRKLTDGVCCEAELFTDEELAHDPLRQEFLRSYGIGAFAAQLVAPMPNFVVAFSVQRSLKEGQFERRELETLSLLGKHAARALLVSMQLAAARTAEQALLTALTRLDCGALVLGGDLGVLHLNPAAERVMGDGLVISQGRLRAQSKSHQAALVRLVGSALQIGTDAAGTGTVALPRPSGRKSLLIQAMPASPGTAADLPAGAAVLMIVVDPENDRRHDPIRELRLLGLTSSEARLAALIGKGASRAEAAEAVGVSQSTANDTMKQIYSKLEISRQSEFVRLVERLAVLKSGPGPGEVP